MSLEDLPSAKQSSDSQSKVSQSKDSQSQDSPGETTFVAPVVAVYGSALHQLNLLDAPEEPEPSAFEPPPEIAPTNGSRDRGGALEDSTATARESAPLQELNELCGLVSS